MVWTQHFILCTVVLNAICGPLHSLVDKDDVWNQEGMASGLGELGRSLPIIFVDSVRSMQPKGPESVVKAFLPEQDRLHYTPTKHKLSGGWGGEDGYLRHGDIWDYWVPEDGGFFSLQLSEGWGGEEGVSDPSQLSDGLSEEDEPVVQVHLNWTSPNQKVLVRPHYFWDVHPKLTVDQITPLKFKKMKG